VPFFIFLGYIVGLIAGGITIVAAAILLATRLCERDRCRLLGLFAWAFKWAVVIGALLAVVTLNAGSGLVVAIMGGVSSALILALLDRGCRVPRLLGQP